MTMAERTEAAARGEQVRPKGTVRDYLSIARLDHSTKHIFIAPGFALAYLLRGDQNGPLFAPVLFGLLTAVSVASANYAINEWLDRDFDRYHPTKSLRASVRKELNGRIVACEWLLLVGFGLACAAWVGTSLFLIACLLALQGLIYNVPPIRTKDLPYIDVISESVNNPLRLMIGWAMVDTATVPPSSIILAYWLGGAFLMAAKRYSEYREIAASHGKDVLRRYRASFAYYSEVSLNVSCFVYAMLSTFFLAVFLIKYRIEYLLMVPAIVALFGYYLVLSERPASSAQRPERLYQERGLLLLLALIVVLFAFTTAVNIPWLNGLAEQHYISLK